VLLPRMLPALALCVALPAWADKRLDEAVAKAEAQLAKGKEDDAVKILEKAASQAPRDPEAQLALARMLTTVGKLDEAGAALGRAGERAAGAPAGVRARVLARRSDFALRAGTAREALALARQAIEADDGAESLAALARAQARVCEPAARETAERATRATPASASAHLARGDALLAALLGPEAEAAYGRALELAPRSAAAATGFALALAAQGKSSPALAAARAATQVDGHFAEAQAALALAALAQDPLDKNGEAVAAVQQASFMEPKSPLVKLALARVFESRGQLDQAAGAYDEAARLDPSWAAPRVAALSLKLRRGDAEGALAGLRALPDELQASGEAQLLLGTLLLRKEDSAGAKAALDRAVAALPGSAEAQASLGTAAYNVGELTLAADAYGRAAALEPANLAYLSNHALFLGYDGRLEEGLSRLLEATGRPGSPDAGAFINLGWIYRSFNPPRVAEAVAAYEKALKLEPKNARAAMGVALSYRAGKQWARAISAYERVATLDPRLDGEASLGTAWCYYRSGDDYKARFFAGMASKAGADVGALRRALSKPAKAEDEPTELVQQLTAKNAGEQAFAVRRLAGLGRPAVSYLASALGQRGTVIAVREAIVDALGRLGPVAREALPQLDRSIKAGPLATGPGSSAEERAREARLIAAMQGAAGKIRGK
jgi:tetratricopeptide (TPR) repeat protein